jgi:8-oxo-dGTP pyrophosphatase MutT (NUDIX family)
VNGNSKAARADVVVAAGGLVWRDSPRGTELAVVHRPQHGDWTLPKGKLDPGERWQDAALREVEEETGLHVELAGFAGSSSYMTNRAPKVVLYWHMIVIGEADFDPDDPSEVDALDWLAVPEARKRLTYERDRKVLDEALAMSAAELEDDDGKAGIGARLRAALRRR